jgi:hypothetical protein
MKVSSVGVERLTELRENLDRDDTDRRLIVLSRWWLYQPHRVSESAP